jgi:nucleoside 2-deoxyribosyltransferase
LRNRERIEKILIILERCGAKTICVLPDIEKWGKVHYDRPELMRVTLREIRNAHLVVVDLTEKGMGLGIEAGYAVARGIPVVVIAQRGSEISPTMQGISSDVFYYDEWTELEVYFHQILFGQAV